MLINCLLVTSDNYGDHYEKIMIATTVTADVTIGELIKKCFEDGFKHKHGSGRMVGNELTDHIEIRIAS